LEGRQPLGHRLGVPGPDQGYALLLARELADGLHLQAGEHLDDVMFGAAAVANKRAALFGRAPSGHDLKVAYAIWGFSNPQPPAELLAMRREMFEECHNPHFYVRSRRIADAVPHDVLFQPTQAILDQVAQDWRSAISLAAPA
jgi:hypothetical protein